MESSAKDKSISIQNRQPIRVITSTLESLFQQADFINGCKANDKICFKSSMYINKDSWYGTCNRWLYSESSSDLIQKIKSLCSQLIEQLNIVVGEGFRDLILMKLVSLRGTCIRLRDSSYSGDTNTFIQFNTIITSIAISLPDEIRESQGIPKIGGDLHIPTPFTRNGSPQFCRTLTSDSKCTPPSFPEDGQLLADKEEDETTSEKEDESAITEIISARHKKPSLPIKIPKKPNS